MKTSTQTTVRTYDAAPDFVLANQDNQPIRLFDRTRDKIVVLYFYPKDESPGCTAEACSFRDSFELFSEAGADVIGVSDDSPESHRQFVAKHRLPFTLLSDPDGAVRKRYGVESVFGLLRGRVTFVIDQQNRVQMRFSSMLNAAQHVTQALTLIKGLRERA